MANKDLFKQAIADAKSIREAAIANAKAALEESLTPQLKELLAQRLAEMEEETETEEVLMEAEVEETETMEEGDYAKEEVAEAEEAEEGEEEAEEEAGEEEAEDDAEESEDEAEEIEDMTVEDLKDLIRDILSQEMEDTGDAEDELGDEMDDAESDMMAADDMTAADDEEINLEELMSELAEMAKDETVTEEETVEEGDYQKEGEHMEEETIDEGFMDMMKKIYNDPEVLGKLITVDGKKMSLKDFLAMAGGATAGSMAGGGAPSSTKTPGSGVAEAELNEALETVETLRKELNETNLLNAKLLYVNKVFKANNLNESQKANVIAAFDKAETVKEVKLVFETVSENVPSGNKKEVVREARGFASAAVGKSDKPEVITEANDVVLRMQKLAGIIK